MRQPNPLQWPADWSRTSSRSRSRSRFSVGMHKAVTTLRRELALLGATNVVITSDLPYKGNGDPYSNARVSDPGVAVWFVHNGTERVIACDRWDIAGDNIHAICLTVAALRGIDRWGASDMVTRAFAGFAALPAPPQDDWRAILGITQADKDTLVMARVKHRNLMKAAHPDAGGSHERAVELNRALQDAERELGGQQ